MSYDSSIIPLAAHYYDLILLTHRWVAQFKKGERYALGERLEQSLIDALSQVYYANPLPNPLKENHILVLNAKNETAKILFRLAMDIKALDYGKYEQAQSILKETGKMIGGWLKYVKNTRSKS